MMLPKLAGVVVVAGLALTSNALLAGLVNPETATVWPAANSEVTKLPDACVIVLELPTAKIPAVEGTSGTGATRGWLTIPPLL